MGKEDKVKKSTISNPDSIDGVLGKFVKGEITPSEYLEQQLARGEEVDAEINIFVNTYADKAREQLAAQKDQASSGTGIRNIPTTIKDNYSWTDTKTTASSKILENYISPFNATVTERLLAGGALIMGKTNLDAFAHGSSTETSDFGLTKNPYDHSRVAGGSSGGSAAAVAAGVGVYSIGSETAGSVRGPAAWCGTYGFAPTYGRFSRYGVVAMGSSLDRPGVLANSALDCAIVSDVLAGHDPFDATSIPEGKTDYSSQLSADNPKLKLGIPKVFFDERIDSEIRVRVDEVLKEYEKLGAEIVEIDLLDPKYAMAVYTIICRSEVSSNLARIDGIRYGHYSDSHYDDVISQIAQNRGEGFGDEAKQRSLTGAYALSAGYYDAYYKKAQQVRTLIAQDFERAFAEVDLIVGPTMPTVAPKIGVTADNPLFGELADILTEPSALAGLPCISIPVGENNEGLPIGFQIIGRQYAEQQVLDAAYIYDKKIK